MLVVYFQPIVCLGNENGSLSKILEGNMEREENLFKIRYDDDDDVVDDVYENLN